MPDWVRELREAIAPLDLDPAREAEVLEELGQHLRDRHEEMQMRGMSEAGQPMHCAESSRTERFSAG